MRTKDFLKVMPIALGVIVTSCDIGSNAGSGGNFSVTSVSPASGSNISPNQSITVNFSNNVNESSLNNNVLFQPQNGESATPASCLGNNNTVVCTPTKNLLNGKSYNLIFNTNIKNPAGNSLNYSSFSYTVFTAPAISNIYPLAGSISPKQTQITVNFSESINPSTISAQGNVTLNNLTNNESVPITCETTDNLIMQCNIINPPLIANNNYQFTITNKVTSR